MKGALSDVVYIGVVVIVLTICLGSIIGAAWLIR